ncbi:hypothetical protein J1N35_001130 [Gossypium stocksii]|uniref:Uncharacterized protein n=1 Tax=Gossypium stocksii TaxID=47602 RepID=A0A9D4AKS0_9ROSI|nr:hypothetical protein J1N35_001130 [Gossypium stocksii]
MVECVSTARAAVLVNGATRKEFQLGGSAISISVYFGDRSFTFGAGEGRGGGTDKMDISCITGSIRLTFTVCG